MEKKGSNIRGSEKTKRGDGSDEKGWRNISYNFLHFTRPKKKKTYDKKEKKERGTCGMKTLIRITNTITYIHKNTYLTHTSPNKIIT